MAGSRPALVGQAEIRALGVREVASTRAAAVEAMSRAAAVEAMSRSAPAAAPTARPARAAPATRQTPESPVAAGAACRVVQHQVVLCPCSLQLCGWASAEVGRGAGA